ncbi:SusD/RagB family nutrient-binding outer membrane lipoprotein [Christiangramia portivictoriae]|uniref:SusD/RagB family nutrient-binding outer membrane lipoprotein n=1 Tax=Christiangramia portivictoriae TaxID=326069 RepID=UPI0004050DCF|nr:SusD/RagB family nutrient-binding outer membrane lipoprotein [Christiangramia portivictoriae]
MKMNFIKKSVLFASAIVCFSSCEKVDFHGINENPNEPTQPSSGSLLASAEGAVSAYVSATTPNLYVQYLSNGQYDEESRYQTLNWDTSYWYGVLTDIDRMIEISENPNQIAAGTILRVYLMEGMTTRWGRLPYSEALQGLENQFPAYDSQEEIYNGLFAELDSALAMIQTGGTAVQGDYIFGGDVSRWESFGQTLKMVMALRLSNADPALGQQKFNEALGNEIMSNSDNFTYPYLADENNDNPWEDRFLAPSFRRDYLVSDVFVNALVGSGSAEDPEDERLMGMAEPAFNSGTFVGAPYGMSNSATDDYSFITEDIIYNQEASLYMFTYAEVLFARAEAAELGWTSEDAEDLYAQAITASFQQWGQSSEDASDYINENPYDGLESIGYEKWVALYFQGYEAWAEWRRLEAMGYEKALTAPDDLLSNATDIPDRQAYAATAASLNEESYNEAISAQGADELNTKIWLFE